MILLHIENRSSMMYLSQKSSSISVFHYTEATQVTSISLNQNTWLAATILSAACSGHPSVIACRPVHVDIEVYSHMPEMA